MKIKHEEHKHIRNNRKYGLIVDWQKLKKYSKQLNIPHSVYDCQHIPWEDCTFNVLFSRRNTGKTTNLLLQGLLLHEMYHSQGGTTIELLRQSVEDTKASYISTLFDTIIKYGYVEKITNGRYTSIWYHSQSFYLCNFEENEKTPKDRETKPFCKIQTLDKFEHKKSSYVNDDCLLVILDEFEHQTYRLNEFDMLLQTISTIRRSREDLKICLLGNTINPRCPYFKNLLIDKIVLKMQPRERKIFTTPKGTPIYIEYVEPIDDNKPLTKETELEKIADHRYYGFENVNSLLGGGWDISNYPHITQELYREHETLSSFYIEYDSEKLKCDLCYTEEYGQFIYVSPTNEFTRKQPIFTNKEVLNSYYIYGVGVPRQAKLFSLFKLGRMLFATNDCGAIVEQFLHDFKFI